MLCSAPSCLLAGRVPLYVLGPVAGSPRTRDKTDAKTDAKTESSGSTEPAAAIDITPPTLEKPPPVAGTTVIQPTFVTTDDGVCVWCARARAWVGHVCLVLRAPVGGA